MKLSVSPTCVRTNCQMEYTLKATCSTVYLSPKYTSFCTRMLAYVYCQHVAFQSILHLTLCANAAGRHMRSRKLHPCPVSALFFPYVITDNKYLLTLLNHNWAISYPLDHKHLSMWASVVDAVSAVLLLLFFLFTFIFYCETTAQDSVATLRNNWLLQNKFNARATCAHM